MNISNTKVPTPIQVEPLNDLFLKVTFDDGTVKLNDIKPYLNKYDVFKQLLDKKIFNNVTCNRYGIVWNDEVDLSIYSIWENGKTITG
jgi:ASC-1-like (ASCH) protein